MRPVSALDDARATAELFDRMTEKLSGYDDYECCGIPESIVRNDLDLIASATEVSDGVNTPTLVERYETVDSLIEAEEDTVAERIGASPEDARTLRESLVRKARRDDLNPKPSPSLLTAYKSRYWNAVNYGLNLVGATLIGSALFVTNADSFWSLIWLSVSFFLMSPVVTYCCQYRSARLIQWGVSVSIFILWLGLGYGLNIL